MHSHLAVSSSPHLNGASDGNSFKGPSLPVCVTSLLAKQWSSDAVYLYSGFALWML
jgi:hypothetical protein